MIWDRDAINVCKDVLTLSGGNFFRLLTAFANSLDPDQDRQSVGPDLDPNCLPLWYSWKKFIKMLIW